MGTFTLAYLAKKAFERKGQILALPLVMYFGMIYCYSNTYCYLTFKFIGYCWDEAGRYKREMMKGHSRMFAERIQAMPRNADPWTY